MPNFAIHIVPDPRPSLGWWHLGNYCTEQALEFVKGFPRNDNVGYF